MQKESNELRLILSIAAAGYDDMCEASKQAYSRAKAEGKTSKIAGVIAPKTFYVFVTRLH